MKKRYIFLIVLILLIVVPMLELCAKKQETNQEIQYILRSEEGRELMEEKKIRREDPKAFTEEGIIKSYEIDYNSVEHNPMGGFTVTTYMNNDKELYMRFLFDKDRGYLDRGGITFSGKLDDMLEGR